MAQKLVLQVEYYWIGQRVGVTVHDAFKSVVVGPRRSDFPAAPDQLGGRKRVTLARREAGRVLVCFGKDTLGLRHRGEDHVPLAVLRQGLKSTLKGTFELPLEPGDVIWIEVGDLRAGLSFVPGSHRVMPVRAAYSVLAFAAVLATVLVSGALPILKAREATASVVDSVPMVHRRVEEPPPRLPTLACQGNLEELGSPQVFINGVRSNLSTVLGEGQPAAKLESVEDSQALASADDGTVAAAILESQRVLDRCYQAAPHHKSSSRWGIKLATNDEGAVTHVGFSGIVPTSLQFQSCVVDELRTWRLPRCKREVITAWLSFSDPKADGLVVHSVSRAAMPAR